LWVFNLIYLDKLLLLLALVDLYWNTINLLLVFLHLDDLVQVLSLLLFTTLEVKVKIAFSLLTPISPWHHIQSLFDSLDISLLMKF
jgi:hypothetical protein